MASFCFWGDTTQGHVWTFMVIGQQPSCYKFQHPLNRIEQVICQPFLAQNLVVTFNIRILL